MIMYEFPGLPTVSFWNPKPTHLTIEGVRIDLKTGEVTPPEGVPMTEAFAAIERGVKDFLGRIYGEGE